MKPIVEVPQKVPQEMPEVLQESIMKPLIKEESSFEDLKMYKDYDSVKKIPMDLDKSVPKSEDGFKNKLTEM